MRSRKRNSARRLRSFTAIISRLDTRCLRRHRRGVERGGEKPGLTRRYSAFGLFREGLRGHTGWQPGMALAKAQAALRRRHHRRRRPWAGDGLLPRQEPRHEQCRGDREGLARRRQYRPQHHHHPLQLFLSRERRALRFLAETLRGAEPRAQLQHHAVAARRGDGRPFRRRDGNRRAHRQRHADQRHRCRAAGTGRRA